MGITREAEVGSKSVCWEAIKLGKVLYRRKNFGTSGWTVECDVPSRKLYTSSKNDTWCPTKMIDNLWSICHSIELHELVLGKFGLIFSDHFGQSYGTQNVQNVLYPYREGWLPSNVIIKVVKLGQTVSTLFWYNRALNVLQFCWGTQESGIFSWHSYGHQSDHAKTDFLTREF